MMNRAPSSGPIRPYFHEAHVLRNGFTIVELLIVIVVIAVLAAVTITAYAGIQNRAKRASASWAAAQATKKVLTYATINSDLYPATLADAGVADTDSTTYQYRVDNAASPKTFCLTATSQNASFFASNSSSPASGACAGHGANGLAAITNYVPNPRLAVNASYYSAQTPTNTATRVANDGPDGQPSYNISTTASGQLRSNFRTSAPNVTVTAGEQIAVSAYVYCPQVVSNAGFEIQWSTGWVYQSFGSTQVGWNRYSVVATVPASATYIAGTQLLTSSSVGSGQTFKITSAMVTKSSTVPGYADGDSMGWLWNGAANNSTSTGSPL